MLSELRLQDECSDREGLLLAPWKARDIPLSPFQTGLSPSSPFAALGKFSEMGTWEGQCSPAPIGSEPLTTLPALLWHWESY